MNRNDCLHGGLLGCVVYGLETMEFSVELSGSVSLWCVDCVQVVTGSSDRRWSRMAVLVCFQGVCV